MSVSDTPEDRALGLWPRLTLDRYPPGPGGPQTTASPSVAPSLSSGHSLAPRSGWQSKSMGLSSTRMPLVIQEQQAKPASLWLLSQQLNPGCLALSDIYHSRILSDPPPRILDPGLGTEPLPGALCSGTGSPALGLCSP